MDFAPLFRSTIGFDRLFDLLNEATDFDSADNYPPYNIAKVGEDTYRITMAVAGFIPDELTVTAQQNLLVVAGRKQDSDNGHYLHRGIATRAFERRFELADYVEVKGARLENGLLTIDLVRELPEEMKPRRIEIAAGAKAQAIPATPQIEDKARIAA
jgi:molecular chaperone IbpA